MKRRQHDIVEVHWIDSSSCGAETWNDISSFLKNKTETLEWRSIGYLIFETDDRIGICASLSLHEDSEHFGIGQVSGTMTIPKIAIVKMRVLSKGKPS